MISPELMAQPWFHGLFYGLPLVSFIMTVGGAATWWERKWAARMQNRIGPNIVGPLGVLQPLADVVKMLQKEDIVPRDADRALFQLAPMLPAFLVLATAAVIPFAGWWGEDGVWQNGVLVADLDVGILWVLALAGLMVFPTWMAGWASNNKYALLAGMRSVAQGISYEIPLVLSAMVPVIATGELSISGMVTWQAHNGWIIWSVPGVGLLALIIFFLSSLAEANRIPFDIPEAESELVAGVLVEYTGIKVGIFMLAEYLHTFVASALAATMFLGGAHGPMPELFGPVWMLLKTGCLFVLIYWIRWSWYRFRADQLMDLCWKWLVPISLVLVMLTALMVWADLLLIIGTEQG